MLLLDTDNRLTAEQALAHPYLATYSDPDDEVQTYTWSASKFSSMLPQEICLWSDSTRNLGYYVFAVPCAGISYVRTLLTIRFRLRLEITEVNHVLWAHSVFHSFFMRPGVQWTEFDKPQ